MRRVALVIVIVGLVLWPGAASGAKSYSAERFDVDLVLQKGGSMQVTETVVFRFAGGPFSYVFRELPTDKTDGIDIGRAVMDGQTLSGGSDAGQAEIRGRDPIRVTWHFAPTADSVHTFALTYRVTGVVRQEAGTDLLLWQALPDEYDYPIASSTVRVQYPAGLTPADPPAVTTGRATVDTGDRQVRFVARDLAPNSPLIIRVPFAAGSLLVTPPAWQTRALAASRALPGFGALALAIFASGLAGMLIYRQRRSRPVPGADAYVGRPTAPPSRMPTALAGALGSSGHGAVSWDQAMGTLLDFAQRGLIRVAESDEHKWYRPRDFIIYQAQRPSVLLPHEEGLWQILFESKQGPRDQVRLSELTQGLSRAWKRFSEPLQAALREAGYVDANRELVRRRYYILGGGLLAAGVVGLLAAILLIIATCLWALILPTFALDALAMVAFILGGATPTWSERGMQAHLAWKAFAEYLKDVARGREAISRADLFENYLPYAGAFGLAEKWTKFFSRQGEVVVPAWFRTASGAEDGSDVGVFVAWMSATHAAGGSSGAGAAGAGAAGGGASGAG